MPVFKAEGVVLRRYNLGEADRVVVLLTREHGKIRAAARGTRKVTSRLAGRLEPFTEATFLLARGRSLDVVAQVDVATSHAALRRDLDRMTHAAYLVEMVDAFVGEREPNEPIYFLLQEALTALETADAPLIGLRFALQLSSLLGYRPAFERCAACGRTIPGGAGFSIAAGGALCAQHQERDPSAVALDRETLHTLARLLARGPMPEVPAESVPALADLVRRYLEFRLEGRLRAPALIERLTSQA